jgi:membrane-associated phospholipid phosphatase
VPYHVLVTGDGLRDAEWVILAYFAYVAILVNVQPINDARAADWGIGIFVLATVIFALLNALERRTGNMLFPVFRDWLALAFTIVAYREMDWFSPEHHTHVLENSWVVWDRYLLDHLGLRRYIEFLGPLIPSLLELCYFVVYAVGPFAVGVLYWTKRQERAPDLLFLYEAGTLLAYACFPFFLSEPPRTAFPGMDMPTIHNWLRRANLGVVNGYGIHSSVFPSAHVSSAVSAAIGMIICLPEKPWFGRGLLIYALLVSVAVIYGRYHYAIDSVAGIGVAVAGWMFYRYKRRRAAGVEEPVASLRQ